MTSPTLLCILDGFGFNPKNEGNAVAQAKKPVIDELLKRYPNATLTTFGEAVGLPEGQMGNSEVGHLNIGAGRVVEQWLLRISRAFQGSFLKDSSDYQTFSKATTSAKTIHIVGLYSTGGVHSHLEHMKLFVKRLVEDNKTSQISLHLISDGRDVSPTAFKNDLAALQTFLKDYPRCSIASVCGRFFAMDRDKRWERVQVAYDAIALGKGTLTKDLNTYVQQSYEKGTTDEFLEPAVTSNLKLEATDGLVFFNFREDRMREIVSALCAENFDGFARSAPLLQTSHVLCFTEYDHTLHLPFLFSQLDIKNHLGETVAASGKKQLRVAETEKYPHVTYFLNGGIEKPYEGEDRKLVPSPRDVKTYDLKPEMSGPGVAELVVEGIRSNQYDLIVVNFANCDMVGHTGVVPAGIKAVETVDACLGQILKALRDAKGQALIIADHGNAEQMVNYEDGTPHTAHTLYPVPVILVDYARTVELRKDGALCDVAPTLLKMMGLPQPKEMTGNALFA
jgi:2,3-bisphosphoglycerate-independent phosphoglycerate mutase